jgi:hypothetical protein
MTRHRQVVIAAVRDTTDRGHELAPEQMGGLTGSFGGEAPGLGQLGF